ncbi:tyrosine--tRNA ligase [Lentisphaerota bacterium WC36G]|nr:tyrosine--tRNA ligase [Lentisphaerae bacterium WC36]
MKIENAYKDLKSRGFIYQETDAEKTEKLLTKEQVTFYVGFDPTGDSLHVGHLLPIMAMRRLQMAGHKPIVLVGGATALVGDPSGKSEARPIITKEIVAYNVECLKKQLSKFISVEDAIFVNNADWLGKLSYIDFLRDVGSKFSINKMLSAESVKIRLETGLSFLEFNYSLLQAYDFHVLNGLHNCKMQFGGQDQWGNIIAGIDLVRKLDGNEVTGTTFPLLLDSNGQKFGKTAGGAVWLNPEKTSIFDYYQFWRNCEDSDVEKLLNYFTSLPVEETKRLGALEAPAINRAKEILAYEATKLAHNAEEAQKAFLAAGNKFGFADKDGKIETTSDIKSVKIIIDNSADEDLPTYELATNNVAGEGMWILKLFVEAGLANSNGDARRLVKGGGAYLNDQRISDANLNITADNFTDNSLILKAGKKKVKRIVLV